MANASSQCKGEEMEATWRWGITIVLGLSSLTAFLAGLPSNKKKKKGSDVAASIIMGLVYALLFAGALIWVW
jgi:hypothetical protein